MDYLIFFGGDESVVIPNIEARSVNLFVYKLLDTLTDFDETLYERSLWPQNV